MQRGKFVNDFGHDNKKKIQREKAGPGDAWDDYQTERDGLLAAD